MIDRLEIVSLNLESEAEVFLIFFLELFIMKEGPCAVTHDLYGDWSPCVSGKRHHLCISTMNLQ